jgi:lantibiotic biosynthesis protein
MTATIRTAQASAIAEAAEHAAEHLARPESLPDDQRWRAQSLFQGAAGIALLHIERAHNGLADWQTAHAWTTAAASGEISAAADSGLHFGATALSYVLHAAQADGTARYATALATLDRHVAALAHRRVNDAQARIDRGDLPAFAEYDLLHGLTGIGAHLLRNVPSSDALGRVLRYLVRLTVPLRIDGETLPGWWVCHDPQRTYSAEFPGGHANLGIAHGVTGPLALLAHAMRRGIVVEGHSDAIAAACAWLDTWRDDTDAGPAWPQWITREQLRTGRPSRPGPLRPSWCYGTPGIARAQQLAALATADTARQDMAEHALARCITDPAQLSRITDTSLCHGWAGLYQTAWRAAREARTPAITGALPHLTDLLIRHGRPAQGDGIGLLEGDAGLALAFHTAAHPATAPIGDWDTCLLIN